MSTSVLTSSFIRGKPLQPLGVQPIFSIVCSQVGGLKTFSVHKGYIMPLATILTNNNVFFTVLFDSNSKVRGIYSENYF